MKVTLEMMHFFQLWVALLIFLAFSVCVYNIISVVMANAFKLHVVY